MGNSKKEDYNSIPVFYCKQCLSLRVMDIPGVQDTEFCDTCNSTNIASTDINTWEKLYYEKYGRKFLDEFKY